MLQLDVKQMFEQTTAAILKMFLETITLLSRSLCGSSAIIRIFFFATCLSKKLMDLKGELKV